MYGLDPFSFLGLTAAKPMAIRIRIQNTKMSTDLHKATSHFADSSGKKAARLVANGFSRSMVPYGFRNSVRMKSGLLIKLVRNACAVMLNEVLKFVLIPPIRL